MSTWLRRLRLPALLLAVLLAASVGAGALRPTASPVQGGFSINADTTTVNGVIGGSAGVAAIVANPFGGFKGLVNWTVTGLPAGSAALMIPSVTLPGIPSILTVTAGPKTKIGVYYLTVTGTSGGYSASVQVKFVVVKPTGLYMTVDPPSRTVVNGQSATYNATIYRGLLTGLANLSVVSGLPPHATASASPSWSLLGKNATVTIKTTTNTPPGVYPIKIRVVALFDDHVVTVYLVVEPEVRPNFPIAGTPDRLLAPGAPAAAVDLALTNPFTSAMTVTNIHMTATGVDKPGCALDNYTVADYSGPASLVVPAGTTRKLSALGVPRAQWPQIAMINKPTNQDICKNAKVNLSYTAQGSGN